ncbi:putative membrane protein [Marmoricola sp. OAE513]|uniref:carotenoid biosynthesis protein n=1 Tax=Marmoricola sp. OAE513 TaxID=2817894 RepID=UPI001AE96DF9
MDELLYSMTHRWYVTLFLVSFLVLGYLEQRWKRTLFWTASGYLITLAAEWGSINHQFPFGDYKYVESGLSKDLMVFGVPFFDSLSFAFLSYVSFAFAQFLMSPVRRRGLDVQRVTSRRIRNSLTTLVLASFLLVVIDWVTDPVSLLGEHTFLGQIYRYPDPGYHWGITQANYIGWFFVGIAIIGVNQLFDAYLAKKEVASGTVPTQHRLPLQGLFAPLFWAGIVIFQLGMTYWVGWSYDLKHVAVADRPEFVHDVRNLFFCGLYIVLPILFLTYVHLTRGDGEPKPEEIAAWERDFPEAPA